jgi:hypothetical protein
MTINNAESIPATVPATRPPGRPPGSRNRRTLFVESLFSEDTEKVRQIVETAIQRAIEGDADFAKLVLARIAPEPKGRRVEFELPRLNKLSDIKDAINAVLQAVADGALTIEEGEAMASVISKHAQPVIQEADLESRIMALESEQRR